MTNITVASQLPIYTAFPSRILDIAILIHHIN